MDDEIRHAPVPGEGLMVVSGLLAGGLIVAAWIAGAGSIETYPVISGGFEPDTLALAVLIPVIAALPFATPRELRRLRPEGTR